MLKLIPSKFLFICILLFFMLGSITSLAALTGDVNTDLKIDIVDALMVARYYVGIIPANFDTEAGDVDGNGQVTILDALMIAHYYVKLVSVFPVDRQNSTNQPTSSPIVTPVYTVIQTPTATPTIGVTNSPRPPTPTKSPATSKPTPTNYALKVNPAVLDMGSVQPGGDASLTFTLTNSSSQAVTVSAITLAPTSVFSYGDNLWGELGVVLPDKGLSYIPQAVPLENVRDVETSFMSTFFLKEDGTLWSCGSNNDGQLGLGTTGDQSIPLQVNIADVAKVSSSLTHTLILKSDGSLWGCGSNSSGQLGLPNTSGTNSEPVQIMAAGVRDMAAGGGFSFILKEEGTLWATGVNKTGQLGIGTTENARTPVLVMSDSSIVKIAAGSNHTMLLKEDGSLWAAGQNTYGQLGNGTTTNSLVFVKIAESGVIDVEAGAQHTLIRKTNNILWGCGDTQLGQLGRTGSKVLTFVQIAGNVTRMKAGSLHTLFQKSNGELWGCGSNGLGQLADADYNNDKFTPVLLHSAPVTDFSGGFAHTIIIKPSVEISLMHTGLYPLVISSNDSYSFNIEENNAYLEGPFGAVLTIESDQPYRPVIHIPVHGLVSTNPAP